MIDGVPAMRAYWQGDLGEKKVHGVMIVFLHREHIVSLVAQDFVGETYDGIRNAERIFSGIRLFQ